MTDKPTPLCPCGYLDWFGLLATPGNGWQRTWRAETIALATVWAFLGAGLFWGTFAPTAAATKAVLLSYDQLHQACGHYRVDGP